MIFAKIFFSQNYPNKITLDGELFGGRGKFQSTVSVVKSANSTKWKQIKYCVSSALHTRINLHAHTHTNTHTLEERPDQFREFHCSERESHFLHFFFQVFDAPSIGGDPFEERLKKIEKYFEDNE